MTNISYSDCFSTRVSFAARAVPSLALMLTVSLLVPAIPTTLIAPPAEAILILLPSSRSISAVSKLIDVPDVLNSTVVAFLVTSINSPLCASIFVVPVPKLYKAQQIYRSCSVITNNRSTKNTCFNSITISNIVSKDDRTCSVCICSVNI